MRERFPDRHGLRRRRFQHGLQDTKILIDAPALLARNHRRKAKHVQKCDISLRHCYTPLVFAIHSNSVALRQRQPNDKKAESTPPFTGRMNLTNAAVLAVSRGRRFSEKLLANEDIGGTVKCVSMAEPASCITDSNAWERACCAKHLPVAAK